MADFGDLTADKKMVFMVNEVYEAPQVEVIEVEVEKGFATSGNPEGMTPGDGTW